MVALETKDLDAKGEIRRSENVFNTRIERQRTGDKEDGMNVS
jgi:hypothetical protein